MSKQKNNSWFYIGICTTILFLILSFSIVTNQSFINFFDKSVINLIANKNQTNLIIAKKLTVIGNTSTITILALLLTIFLITIKKYYFSLFVVVTMTLANASNWIIKNTIKRPRPEVHHLVYASGYSFPSGHSLGSITLFGLLLIITLLLIKNKYLKVFLSLIFILAPLIIGYTRIYLHVHYPSDVLGGWLEGLSFLLIIYSIFKRNNLLKKGSS